MIEADPDPCIERSYCSDIEDAVDNVVSITRLKMTEGERLVRWLDIMNCRLHENHSTPHLTMTLLQNSRERNRLHAKSTRDRKKTHMDCLESRIEELVDEVS